MLGLGLRQLQEALNRKADEVQREFLSLSDVLGKNSAELLELEGEARQALREEQRKLREHRTQVADEVNLWRERARSVTQTGGDTSLRDLLVELKALDDPVIRGAIERVEFILERPQSAQDEFEAGFDDDQEETPAARLITRGLTEYSLRLTDSTGRERTALEFANRPGISQDPNVLTELEAAFDHPDPMVEELVRLTLIQIYRFRALRFADLEKAHQAVQELARMKAREVVPVLAEIIRTPRTGFTADQEEGELIEATNTRSRMVALLRLVEWHTPEAQIAIRNVQFDKEAEIARAAKRALEVFPGQWTGTITRPQA
ncbi:MAG: hypothetical protein WBR18_06430 [Anaerolineales bacterium]